MFVCWSYRRRLHIGSSTRTERFDTGWVGTYRARWHTPSTLRVHANPYLLGMTLPLTCITNPKPHLLLLSSSHRFLRLSDGLSEHIMVTKWTSNVAL